MKTSIMITCFILLAAASCTEKDVAIKLRDEAAQKIKGKWMLQRLGNDVYSPITTFSSCTERIGTEKDFFEFKINNRVTISSAPAAQSEVIEVINPYQLKIDNDVWRIDNLAQEEMLLVLDRNDVVNNKRNVTKMYL